MGIHNLWKAVESASQTRTLTQIAVTEGFEQPERRPERCLLLGIDASIWMNQAQIGLGRGTGTQAGENPAIRVLFYRLCRLLALPIIPIFVFDGAGRPSKKRGISVKAKKPHWLTTPFQKFIDAFGFSWYTAPGEAEADLAELDKRQEIDAVISEDSDTLVFGARHVIRMQNVKTDGDQVAVFSAASIQNHPKVRLDREALFVMAILCGGDHDKAGLSGCGYKTARCIARTDLARSLFNAAVSSPSRSALRDFLLEWRESFRILLAHNPSDVLGKKLPALARAVNSNFPSVDILLQYAKPLTSWTTDRIPDMSSWKLRQPRLGEIGNLCEKYLSWASSGLIVARFRKNLWPGVANRRLLQLSNVENPIALYSSHAAVPADFCIDVHVLRICRARLGPGVSGYTVEVSAYQFLQDNVAEFDATLRSLVIESAESKLLKAPVWVPSSVLGAALPDLIRRFKGKKLLPVSNPPPVLGALPAASAHQDHEFVEDSSGNSGAKFLGFVDLCSPSPPPPPPSSPPSYQDVEFVEGSSTNSGAKFLGFVDLRTPSPPPSHQDVEFVEGSSTNPGVKFLGFLDLCTPSPPSSPPF